MSQDQTTSKGISITIKFLFNHTADLPGTRKFYSELIGLKEAAFNAEWGYLNYQCDGFELMYFTNKRHFPELPTDWASQPGYEGGPLEITSWAIQVPDDQFPAIVKRLQDAGIKCFNSQPEWRQDSYWGYTVMDPNNVTVEVYSIPSEKPEQTEWIAS